MTDYIKREDAENKLAKIITGDIFKVIEEEEKKKVAKDFFSDIPSADVVEVVRCKDCKHYNEYENGEKIIDEEEEVHDGWCMRWSGIENVNRHDYCSYGVRAEA